MPQQDFTVTQRADGWHVRMAGDRERIFPSQEEAEAFARGALADGRSAAQSEARQGDVVPAESGGGRGREPMGGMDAPH